MTTTRKQRHARAAASGRTAHADLITSGEANLRALLLKATDADIVEGTLWYSTAHGIAATLADEFGITLEAAAGIIAALSPQNGWDNNIAAARAFLEDPTVDVHFHNACEKARAILAGAHPLAALRGRKVRSFYKNIANPLQYGPVTIDRHAVAILSNFRDTPSFLTAHPKHLERYGAYHLAAAVYRAVARDLQIPPHHLQAIAWVTWRRIDPLAVDF